MAASSELLSRARLTLAAGRVLAGLLVTGLTGGLAGCGGGAEPVGGSSPSVSTTAAEPTPPTGSSAGGSSGASPTPADGRLAGEGYALMLPDGWQDATDQFQEYTPLIDAGAVDAAQSDQPFSDNVNVLRNADQAELPVTQVERQFADELGTVASHVRVQRRETVDGVEAVHLTGRTKAGEVAVITDQYICFVDDASYVITFSFGTGTPQAQREEEVAAMLASWRWG